MSTRAKRALPLAGLLLAVLNACALPMDTQTVLPMEIEITNGALLSVPSLGSVIEFEARVRDEWGKALSGQPLLWVSSDTSILQPAGDKSFRAVRNGEARVTVSLDPVANVTRTGYNAGVTSAESRVVVKQLPASLNLAVGNATFWALGQALQLSLQVKDANGYALASQYQPIWTVVDPGVVAVDSSGMAKAIRDGDTNVVVRVDGLTASAALKVAATIPFRACLAYQQSVEQVCASASVVARVQQ